MKAVGVSQGIAIGKAYNKTSAFKLNKGLVANIEEELVRLYFNVERSKQQIEEIKQRTESRIGAKEAQIFEAHLMILEDPELLDKAVAKIKNEKINAAWAVHEATEELKQLFHGIEDEYIKERMLDVQDVSIRLIENILGVKGLDFTDVTEPVIVVAKELTPSDMSNMPRDKVLGIITEAGGITSHTVIMSRIMGLPAIVGADDLMLLVCSGDMIVMNGSSGEFYINPEEALVERFERERSIHWEQRNSLEKYIGLKTATKDGFEIGIGCNIGSPKDLEAVLKNDAEGIGLFRSEFLFMDRSDMPTEEEQFGAYRIVAEGMKEKPVIIRTLDIGGDKKLPYMNFPEEENPFLGYRAIRYCLEEKEIFRMQLRAILRASAYGNIKMMLPMISGIDEIYAAKEEIQKSMEELDSRHLSYNRDIELGVMIETPAAAIISDKLAEVVDFFSIGTNDLIQYTLAVDRMNSNISKLYTPFHPAVLRLIKLVADNAKKAGIWIGMCGEAAQEEQLVPIFVAMGLDEVSVSPIQVLKIRKLIGAINKQEMYQHVENILNLPNPEAVANYLNNLKNKT